MFKKKKSPEDIRLDALMDEFWAEVLANGGKQWVEEHPTEYEQLWIRGYKSYKRAEAFWMVVKILAIILLTAALLMFLQP